MVAGQLSIGEVLAQLQREFPDVTISKIRFLESQGLINPERTPSGYRKFSDDDLATLQWILLQQRDHFLPLRVIKERLERGDHVAPAAAPPTLQPVPSDPSERAALLGNGDTLDDERASGSPQAPTGQASPGAGASNPAATGPSAKPDDSPSSGSLAGAAAPSRPADSSAGGPPTSDHSADPAHATGAADASGPEGEGSQVGSATPPARAEVGEAGDGAGAPLTPDTSLELDATTVSMTIEELSIASGLTIPELRELESFRLLRVSEDDRYDGQSLIVARAAKGFASFGVEARHLRMYLTSAEREAGIYEQAALPSGRQRGPEVARQTREAIEQLVHLGDQLRGAMLREALAEHLR